MSQYWSPTPEEAKAQLAQADQAPMSSLRDRRVHAVVLAILGVAMGIYTALLPSFDIPSIGAAVMFMALLAVLLLAYRWRSTVRTKPLDSTRLEKRAGVTMAIAGGVAWQVILATGVGWDWWVRIALGFVYAAPYCIAAGLVLRDRR